jgi:hypothetical protein
MPTIKGVEGGKLIGNDGKEMEMPVTPRAVPKPKAERGVVPKMEGVIPNATFAKEGEGFTLGELDQGSEGLREALSRGAEFIETAMNTTDTLIVGEVLPRRRNISRFVGSRDVPKE